MKAITKFILANLLSCFILFSAQAQTNARTSSGGVDELEILKQLTSTAVVADLPVYQLLNAPGNEQLKAFFFTPVKDPAALKGKRIAVIAADGFEEIEMLGPVWYFRALGAKVDIVAPKYNPAPERYGLGTPEMAKGYIMAIQYLQPVGWVKVDRTADQIKVADYDAIFIPGGAWNPDNLRFDKDVIKYIQDFNKAGKLVAAICHAPVVLATADILKGKKLTGYWNVHADLKNAGGVLQDVPVVTDGNLITSRHPIDVADFSKAVEQWLLKK
ncbi:MULTISPECIES: DJ-1/PfpI/YhbO family deglycase/protease [Dyadobacter]|uniref:DJ-1/PfpI/YhbO family deglycase/protease n=1 Tax=Dyadobacter chenwenxiniae TaxID=2906456 RepID=A0A9X1PQL6_9BACT|nr:MULTISPECIES: DJ-1/PfpI/YhbO family deglycase/protease [Dyadobacter]MCF0065627.1 DJ-1/PfpI/YhbO family deglycase/protease [Dyadobacter chenwenxiniae]MCF2518796.1 DJ-1/PfpI/YhbO family deglycase/protease [Dyadobacter sp. CY351]UON85538.1 DJ-1/PfpI/YhbO family deglycase/protease [Dyadobacter chenwenxiniae]